MSSRVRLVLTSLLAIAVWLSVFGMTLTALPRSFMGLEYVDHYGTQWFYWYTERQLRAGEGFGHTDLFFFPWGKDVFGHTGSNVLDGLFALPFRVLLGPVLGYNVFVLVGTAATAWAFWRLARDHSADILACGLGAVLFALSPYLLHDLTEGRPTQSIMVFPVLFVQHLLRTGTRSGWRAPVLAGLFLALCGFQYWYYALFGGLCALAHGLYLTARPGPEQRRLHVLGRHVLMATVALALVAPLAVPLVLATAEAGTVPGLLRVDLWGVDASPPVTAEGQTIGLFVWQPLERWAGFHVLDDELTEHMLEQALLLPWLWGPAALAFLATKASPLGPRRGPMVAMALTVMVLATGSIVLVGGYALPNLPFIWLSKAVGVLQRLWWPARALAFFTILLGLAIVELLTLLRSRSPRLQAGAAALLTLVWVGELRAAGHVPFPSWDATVPAGYHCLATGPEGAILELPHAWTQAHLYYQTVHGRPIMGGMLENNPVFTPDELTAFREENLFIEQLQTVSRLSNSQVAWTDADAQAVADLGYAYIVLQKDAFSMPSSGSSRADNVMRTRLRRMQKGMRRMLGPPVYDDARIAIFSPWDVAPPCDLDAITQDSEPRGPTEIQADAMVRGGLESNAIQRVWEANLADIVELASDEEEDEAGDTGSNEEEEEAHDTGAPAGDVDATEEEQP